MAKKKDIYSTAAEHHLTQLKFKDLQRENLIRGMEFIELVKADIPRLQSWFLRNYENDVDPNRLDDFDAWLEECLITEQGYDKEKDGWAFHPALKMGYAPVENEEGNLVATKKVKGIKKPKKKKREKVKGFKSLLSGTKKAYTYELTSKGYHPHIIVEKVIARFEDAKDKSIMIWYKKCLKEKPVNPIAGSVNYIKLLKIKKGYSLKKIIKKTMTLFQGLDKKVITKTYESI